MATANRGLPVTLGHYRVVERIGQGGFGEVYRARDEHLQRDVAIKLLPAGTLADQTARQRFRHEALALSKLNHPNIATVHDFATQEGIDFLVTEFVAGASLGQRLRAGALAAEETIEFGIQLAQGLAAAHDAGIVHRDLKPDNIRFTPDGRLKILDFGLAKLVRGEQDATASQSFVGAPGISGTLPYMAPEQLRGDSDLRTDVYGAGAVLYEMATGQQLFPNLRGPQLTDAIFHRPPVAPGKLNPSVPPALEAIILRAIEKDPANRQQSARELLLELQRLAPASGAVSTHSSAWVRRWWWPLARRPRAVLLSSAAILLGVVLAVLIVGRKPSMAFAARDFVLLADFDNQTGDSVFDKSLATAFSTSMQQSQFANVFSRLRIRDALRRMQKPADQKVDEFIAQEIAQREGLKAVILPSINGVGQQYRVAAILRNVATGRDVRTEVFRASGKDQVLNALDKLAAAMRRDLGESLQQVSSRSKPLASVTTSNLQALRQYSIAIEKHSLGQIAEARVYYENALRIDPNFTAAQASLGMMHIEQSALGLLPGFNPAEGRRLLDAAVQHVDGLTDQEKYGILAFHAKAIENDAPKAIGYYKGLLALYPDDLVTHNNLGYLYSQMGRLDDAVVELNEALRVDPRFMPAYSSLIGIHLYRKCELGAAYQTCTRMLRIDPHNSWGEDCVGWVALGKDDLTQAAAAFEKAVADHPDFDLSRYRLAHTYRLQGKYREAIATLTPLLQRDSNDTSALYDLGVNYAAAGDRKTARDLFQRLRTQAELEWKKNPNSAAWAYLLASAYARLGDMPRASALTRRLQALAPRMHFEAATLLSLQDRRQEALDQLEQAVQNGYTHFVFIKIHPDFSVLHGDPRFQALLQRGIKP